jgi:hypothetical protein
MRPGLSRMFSALGKPSVSAAADDCFAQFDVVGLSIALATKRSPDLSVRRQPHAWACSQQRLPADEPALGRGCRRRR